MQITVTVEDKQVKLALSEPMIFPNFLDYMQTAILTFMNATVDKSPKNSDLVALREQIYDTYNQSASNVLAIFAPDIEMRPHLTAQAIIEAENKIIEEGPPGPCFKSLRSQSSN